MRSPRAWGKSTTSEQTPDPNAAACRSMGSDSRPGRTPGTVGHGHACFPRAIARRTSCLPPPACGGLGLFPRVSREPRKGPGGARQCDAPRAPSDASPRLVLLVLGHRADTRSARTVSAPTPCSTRLDGLAAACCPGVMRTVPDRDACATMCCAASCDAPLVGPGDCRDNRKRASALGGTRLVARTASVGLPTYRHCDTRHRDQATARYPVRGRRPRDVGCDGHQGG